MLFLIINSKLYIFYVKKIVCKKLRYWKDKLEYYPEFLS
jgi:hypothetical protein